MMNSSWQLVDYEAYEDGRKDALKSIYANLWKAHYLRNPTGRMMDLERCNDDFDFENRKTWALITFNPIPLDDDKAVEFENEYLYSVKFRSWIKSIEFHKELAPESKRIHYHCIVQLGRLYSPKQIAEFLYKGRGKKWFGSSQAIDIKKFPKKDIKDVKAYATKAEVKFSFHK